MEPCIFKNVQVTKTVCLLLRVRKHIFLLPPLICVWVHVNIYLVDPLETRLGNPFVLLALSC